MNKGQISNLLRRFRLIYFTDWVRYFIQKFKNKGINQKFRKDNPEVKLPADYLIYESFQINYPKYFTESIDAAKWLKDHLNKHIELKDKKILDWGCGPGRIIRHLSPIVNNGCEFYGTDYNKKSIDWCKANLQGIEFHNNSLAAKLPYPDNFFDVIYGISIFTHLSEQMHYDWYAELNRILNLEGIMFLTTQGDNFKVKLTRPELEKYSRNQIVVRGNVKEGHRTFSAFHPQKFMRTLFENVEILEHIADRPESGKWLPQDIWIIKKK